MTGSIYPHHFHVHLHHHQHHHHHHHPAKKVENQSASI
jgi:hypothetical protein